MEEKRRPGQTEEQFRSYLAGNKMMTHRDRLTLFCVSLSFDHVWMASETGDEAIDSALKRLRRSGNPQLTVQRYQYVLGMDIKSQYTTVVHRDGYKALFVLPHTDSPDLSMSECISYIKQARSETEFEYRLHLAGWWVRELPDGRHRVRLGGKTRHASRKDTRCLLAAWVGNRYAVEPEETA